MVRGDMWEWCEVVVMWGCVLVCSVHGHIVWKAVVKEIVLRKKKELRNWKVLWLAPPPALTLTAAHLLSRSVSVV